MKKKSQSLSALKVLLILLLAIFSAEIFLMLAIYLAELKSTLSIVLFDSFFLSILLIPVLYLFVYKPLVAANLELHNALAEIKTLKGIIPICGYCKKIRDDQEIWHQLEDYLIENSEAAFSHGMCPDCYEEQVTEVKKMKQEKSPNQPP